MQSKETGIKRQIVLSISDAYQAIFVIKAIMFSQYPKHRLFSHLYSSEYQLIIVNIGKLFDKSKSATSLLGLIKAHRSIMKNEEYELAIKSASGMEKDYTTLLDKIEALRNNLGAHHNREELNNMYKNISDERVPEATEIQSLLVEIIDLIKNLSFIDEEDLSLLQDKIGAKDVMDLLGLKIDPEISKKIFTMWGISDGTDST